MDLQKICLQVCELCKEVGKFIATEQKNITSESIETKSLNSLVTYVDKTAEERLVKKLKELIPGCGFITEENTDSSKSDEYTWIIDPLDGTTNYIHGIPIYCISIGLTYKNKLVLGVIYEVSLKECFYSWGGGKSYLNGNEIKVSETNTIKDSLISTGFPYYDFEQMNQYINLFTHLMKNSRGVRRLGSAAIDLAYVACGRFDSFYEYSLSPWDVAAGAFIVEQAGGKVSDFKGGENYLFGKELIACNNNTFKELSHTIGLFFK